ncbi:MAG TPA: EpsI family protein [Ktedonobacteraceae bacterium]|nr:EpsI family protein [Ktedonobacteraceae bacterium]
MTTSRVTAVLGVLLAGFGSVFLLPASRFDEPVGIRLALPEYLGQWYGVDQEITERERSILASDTEFARKSYTNFRGDKILVSIVLSGHDLDNSIHRPERCLPAQGLTIVDSQRITLSVPGGSLETTRLHDVHQVSAPGGKLIPVYDLNYYWFVGFHHLTASHLERTWLDIQDRLFKGYNQRWAYITVSTPITQGLVQFGRSEKETDALLQEFIRELFPLLSLFADEGTVAPKS